jgi:hypothetical protein
MSGAIAERCATRLAERAQAPVATYGMLSAIGSMVTSVWPDHRVGHRRAAAAIGHVHVLHVGHRAQHVHRQMRGAAVAGAREADLVGRFLLAATSSARSCRAAWVGEQHQRRLADERDRREVLDLEAGLAVQARVDRDARRC